MHFVYYYIHTKLLNSSVYTLPRLYLLMAVDTSIKDVIIYI